MRKTYITVFSGAFLQKKKNKNEKGGFATTLLPRQLALLLCDSFKDLCSYLLLLLYSHCTVKSGKKCNFKKVACFFGANPKEACGPPKKKNQKRGF